MPPGNTRLNTYSESEQAMAELSYIRQYFTDNADTWVAGAYVQDDVTAKYPLGNERVSLALSAVVERLGQPRGHLLDLGCGGGQLCFEAARAGMQATGIDIADGMVDLCRQSARQLPQEQRHRVDFQVGDVVNTGLDAGQYDAVAALGLIEYVPEDAAFLNEAYRLLRPGGVLVVTCRNRLFNLFSQNDYTQRELNNGAAAGLLDEIRDIIACDVTPDTLHGLLRGIKAALPDLEEAVKRDITLRNDESSSSRQGFAQELRQHTPEEIVATGERAGFINPGFVSVHPHPLPPAYERIAPHFFNTLARTFTIFADKPAGLLWSSCFQVTFTKPE